MNRKITTVLFDLDGTLIGMNQDEFIKLYFVTILDKLSTLGYDKRLMYLAIEGGIQAIKRKNDDSVTNEECFWHTFNEISGGVSEKVKEAMNSYYTDEFINVLEGSCYPYPRANEIIKAAKDKGLRTVLATNPLFPRVATYARIRLGGMDPLDFEYVTSYENSSYCKPNPMYFAELLSKLGISADECVMIGNDTQDDLSVRELGIPTFILTECLINARKIDLSGIPHGGFDDLKDFINSI